MARSDNETVQAEAIAWHLKLADADEAEWDAFSAWLQSDDRNNDAYEAVCDADLGLEPAVALAQAEIAASAIPSSAASPEQASVGWIDLQAQGRGRGATRRWVWSAIAASLVLVGAGTWLTMNRAGQEYGVVTAPGEGRTIALADGSRVVLNGGTEIVLDRSQPRIARLKSGEAQFSVVHDDRNPFTVIVGDQRIVDVGTVFNVRSNRQGLQVEVAQGAVRYEDGVARFRLNAGDTLSANAGEIVEGSKPIADIGSWTQGRLTYRDAPVMEVAADITRARGIAIELGPELSHRTFTGVIQLDGDKAELRRRVELLLGAKVSDTSDGWSITR